MKNRILWMVTIILCLCLVNKSFAQQIPQDFNTVGFDKIHANELNYRMSYLNDNVYANNNFWDGKDVNNAFHNAAAFNPGSAFTNGFALRYSPVAKNLNQQAAAFAIGLNDQVILYGAGTRSSSGKLALVPTVPGINIYTGQTWKGTNVAPYDNMGTIGVVFKLGLESKMNIAVGATYISSYQANGSWNGKVLDHASTVAFNLSAVYNFREFDERSGKHGNGLVIGGGIENMSPYKLNYSSTISRNVPGRSYVGGGYKIDDFSIAGDIGMITTNNMITGSASGMYSVPFSDKNSWNFMGGYTSGYFFKGPMAGVGLGFGAARFNVSYTFANNPNAGFNQLGFGITIFN